MISLVIMAAGLGSRFGSPKQITGVGPHGELLLEYAIYDAVDSGIDQVILVVNPLVKEQLGHFLRHAKEKITIKYVIQEADHTGKPPGTGHATMLALKVTSGPALVMNADDYYGKASIQLLTDHLGKNSSSAMVGYKVENTLSDQGGVSRGLVEKEADGYLVHATEFVEIQKSGNEIIGLNKQTLTKGDLQHQLVSMNLWGFQNEVGPYLSDCFEKHDPSNGEFLLPQAITKGISEEKIRVKVLETESQWFGLTFPADLYKVKKNISRLISCGEYPEWLWK